MFTCTSKTKKHEEASTSTDLCFVSALPAQARTPINYDIDYIKDLYGEPGSDHAALDVQWNRKGTVPEENKRAIL